LHNRGGHFLVRGLHDSEQEAEQVLLKAGGRSPGMVVRVLGTNGRGFAAAHERPRPLLEYEVFAGELVVLGHAPSKHRFQRFLVAGLAGVGEVEKARALAGELCIPRSTAAESAGGL